MTTSDDIASAVKPIADALDAELAAARSDVSEWRSRCETIEADLSDACDRIGELEAQIATADDLKPGLRGLVTTNPAYIPNIPYAEFASTKPRWKDIETAPGVYDFAAVDAMLAAYPSIKFRLRFMAGIHAPDWVKARSGGAIQHDPSTPNGGSGLVPRFWTENFFFDYMAFMRAIADRYEDNPQVVEIPNSLTTTVFAEPFILAADSATIDRYWAAGYRKEKVEQNLRASVDWMMDLFPTTRISLSGHGKWEHIVDGKFSASWPDERTVLNELSATYGARLVIEDHGLGPDDTAGTPQPRETATRWYDYMAGLRDTEQTYGWQFTLNNGSMATAADMGVAMGACFLEYAAFQALDETKRRQVHDALLANGAGKP